MSAGWGRARARGLPARRLARAAGRAARRLARRRGAGGSRRVGGPWSPRAAGSRTAPVRGAGQVGVAARDDRFRRAAQGGASILFTYRTLSRHTPFVRSAVVIERDRVRPLSVQP